MTEPQLRRLQLAELSVLDEFTRLCARHGLRYYLVYGSLLGAVRHGGFIPWDDDIDVAMPREDYGHLSGVIRRELDDRLILQSHLVASDFPYFFSKLVLRGTALRKANEHAPGYGRKIGIDVFALDGVPDSRPAALFRDALLSLIYAHLRSRRRRQRQKRLFGWVARALPIGFLSWIHELTTRIWPASRAKRLVCPGAYRGRHVFPKEWFGEGTPLGFERREVTAPARWHDFLALVYGDYMEFPPVEERTGHGIVDINFGDA